jgi:K+-sensing histidine kinase KdpD
MLSDKKYISIAFDEAELKERNRELSILLEMSNFLATSMNMKDLLAGALSKVLGYFDLEAGRIYLADDEGKHLNLIAHQGIQPYRLEKMRIDEGFSGKAFRTKSFIAGHVSEMEDRDRVPLLSAKGFKIIICVPLISLGEVGGVMNLATSKMITLDQNKVDLLTTIGNQIAVAANSEKLNQELQDKIQRLKEKTEMIQFFAYSVSHDLKSPAIAVYGFAKRLKDKYGDILDERGSAYCDQILKTAEQMVSLLEKINAYIAAKEVPLHFEKVKVKELTEEIRAQFSAKLNERQIKWSEPDILPEIVSDRLSLIRVFGNFVDNALKYGGDDMLEIKVGYQENEAFHVFSFSDDGVGIKGDDKENIFELFQRHETSKGKAGSGLGLSIVKEIAQRHMGEAWVETNSEKGITFYISISKDLNVNNAASQENTTKEGAS